MGREHHKNLQRGIKQPLKTADLKSRASRHGKPQQAGRTEIKRVMVSPGTSGAERVIEVYDPKVNYPEGTVISGDVAVVYYASIVGTRKVAAGPTGTYGQKNSGDEKVRVKKVKP